MVLLRLHCAYCILQHDLPYDGYCVRLTKKKLEFTNTVSGGLTFISRFAKATCKGCDPYGQLLYGMLQVPSAVQTLHTYSMAAHGRSTGAYNTTVTT